MKMSFCDLVFYIKKGLSSDVSIFSKNNNWQIYSSINYSYIMKINYYCILNSYDICLYDDDSKIEHQLVYTNNSTIKYMMFNDENMDKKFIRECPLISTEEEYFMQSTLINIPYTFLEIQKFTKLFNFMNCLNSEYNATKCVNLKNLLNQNRILKNLLDCI